MFPHVDPIPLPAPVWLMKGLGLLTLATHFVAMQLLVGGLFLVCLLTIRGSFRHGEAVTERRQNSNGRVADLSAALVLSRRLPVVTTYVINLGVPPLLFAQVLYGRALYTSSVLIAVLWIAVIFLLMAAYWLQYRIPEQIEQGKPAWLHAITALLLTMGIGQIYSMNMTLMLRPEVWQAMYAHTASGLQAAPPDPTTTPRWLFMMVGGLVFGGVGAQLLSLQPNITEETRGVLRRLGSVFAITMLVPQLFLAFRIFQTQPVTVQQGLATQPLYIAGAVVFVIGAVVILLTSGINLARKTPLMLASWGAALGAVLCAAGNVIYRDGIRDLTLISKGFNVWDRTIVTNWSVVAIFLGLLIVGLGVIGWLIWVVAQMKPVHEGVEVPQNSVKEGAIA